MIDIYEIDEFGQWTGASDQIDEVDGCTPTWVRAPAPPKFPEGGAVVWAIGRWHVRDDRLIAEIEPEEPVSQKEAQQQ
ncbi:MULTISPECIES: hypothetical protein [unclassified Caulobacter]|jgi:hypothetical protein|uniref:hypothetical protein n=1 Tax=unclassified Caulobacter TaxID=2648921 RepID=UPI0006FF41ED|nr:MULTISPECIES: hypothetical protein [unclassified Caulobacter]KQV58438.1 hypothetical protein ASC62_06465 [Caulobacter sp. Root342]KQV69054.1 hypothetical protein ASC70_09570 [Caulobacter sp. Root343]